MPTKPNPAAEPDAAQAAAPTPGPAQTGPLGPDDQTTEEPLETTPETKEKEGGHIVDDLLALQRLVLLDDDRAFPQVAR